MQALVWSGAIASVNVPTRGIGLTGRLQLIPTAGFGTALSVGWTPIAKESNTWTARTESTDTWTDEIESTGLWAPIPIAEHIDG